MSIRKPILALAACAVLSAFAGSLLAQAAPAVPSAPHAVSASPLPVWLALPIGSQFGTCRTSCSGPNGFTIVSWSATLDQCCSGTFNPCPPGTSPGVSSFLPNGGFARLCPIN
jgi:hypothetical protein